MVTDRHWGGERIDTSDPAGRLNYDYYAACSENDLGRLYNETAEVLWSWSDGADEPNWAWLVRLRDNTFAAVEGWHDYTGWDCQSGASVVGTASKISETIRFFSEHILFEYKEQNRDD